MSPRIKKRDISQASFLANENREIRASTDGYIVYFRTENIGIGQQNWKREKYKGKVCCVFEHLHLSLSNKWLLSLVKIWSFLKFLNGWGYFLWGLSFLPTLKTLSV